MTAGRAGQYKPLACYIVLSSRSLYSRSCIKMASHMMNRTMPVQRQALPVAARSSAPVTSSRATIKVRAFFRSWRASPTSVALATASPPHGHCGATQHAARLRTRLHGTSRDAKH